MVRKRNAGQKEAANKKENGITALKSNHTHGNGIKNRVISTPSPPNYIRFLIKSIFGILAIVCFGIAILPYLSDDVPTSWNLQRFLSTPIDRLNGITSASVPKQEPQMLKEPAQAQQEQVVNDELRYIRPAVRFDLDSRQFPDHVIRDADQERREAVRNAFHDSWSAYLEDAFGSDEYHPISRKGSNFSTDGGVGYFIVDTIDMLLITGDQKGYDRARDWVSKLSWNDKAGKFSVFETTIRTLGGLLSAHALCTPDQNDSLSKRTSKLCSPGDSTMFLTKAVELANRLKPAFESNHLGLPEREIDFQTGKVYADKDNQNMISLAEMATIQLEFKFLAHVTGDQEWWDIAEKPMMVIRDASAQSKSDGLMPIFFSPLDGKPKISEIRLGSRGDSYYEYLIKQFVQTNKTELVYLAMYQQSMTGVKTHLMRQSPHRKMLHTIEIHPIMNYQTRRPMLRPTPKQDHLVCFLGGSFMLGALHVQDSVPFQQSKALSYPPTNAFPSLAQEDWTVGHELIKTCVDTYTETKTGLSPEIAMFRLEGDQYKGTEEDWYIKKPNPIPASQNNIKGAKKPAPLIDSRNILRPETVESLFIAFHLTGDEQYREWGWNIFQAFEKATRLPKQKDRSYSAFASIKDVNVDLKSIEFEDRMETFWLAETLKYLFLLFEDQNTLRLDQWVLNTEAHPLPIFTPAFDTNVS